MKALDKLKKLNPFQKTVNKDKEVTKETAVGPWVKVVEVHFDKDNPQRGYFELDWNEYFVQSLKLNGYRGATDEEVVDKWFQDLCRNVASDTGAEEVGGSGYVNKVLRDDGKTEVS